MGVIIRQSIKQTIVSYVAIAIAALAQFFIYPIDDFETYGLAQAIISLALLLYPFIVFGIPQSIIRFFKTFHSEGEGYILNFLIIALVFLLAIGTLLFILYKPFLNILTALEIDQNLFINYGVTVGVIIFLVIILKISISHSANFLRIVWPSIIDNLWTKVALAIAIYLVVSGFLETSSLAITIPLYFGLAVIFILIYLKFIGALNLRYNPKIFKWNNLKSIINYSAFTGLTSMGAILAVRIDQIMIPNMVDYQANGIYSFFIFTAAVIEIPARSIGQISEPIISAATHSQNHDEVEKIYKKSAIILLIFGIALFALILLNIEALFQLMGKQSLLGGLTALFVILGSTRIISMTFSMASRIVIYSNFYKFILPVTVVLGISNTILNYWFIKDIYSEDPLFGAAIATAISIILYNLLIVIFVQIKFAIHPFTLKMLLIAFVGTICFGICNVIPSTSSVLLDIIIKSSLFTGVFVGATYQIRASEDFNDIINQVINSIRDRLSKGKK